MGFLYDVFGRFGGRFSSWSNGAARGDENEAMSAKAIEHVVDQTFDGIRAIPGYAKRLKEPVTTAFQHIDALVEEIPHVFLCSGKTFRDDPRVNAYFVSPDHIKEVFSHSKEVRELFDNHPTLPECCALLCMKRIERRRLGAGLVGHEVRQDVLQTAVSFTDHQVVSPGTSETDARRSLKCCIFGALMRHIQGRAGDAKTQWTQLEHRRRVLRDRLQRVQRAGGPPQGESELRLQLREAEEALSLIEPHLLNLDDHLRFVADVLNSPSQFIKARFETLRLSRVGIVLAAGSTEAGYDLTLPEIQIATNPPRVAALVRIPRSELLPQKDFLAQADLFLHA